MKNILLIILLLIFATISQAQQNSSSCQTMNFLNDEEVDIHASSFVGEIKEIKILAQYPESDEPQEITTTIKFDEKGRIKETYLTNARIKMYGRTIYFYDAQNRIIKKSSYNPDGSLVSDQIFNYGSNGGLELRANQNPLTKKMWMKTEYKYESADSYSQFYDGKFARRIKLTRDNKCRIIESNLYKQDNSLENRITTKFDDKNNVIESIVYSPNGGVIEKRKYEYEYDNKGNWIKKNIFEWTFRDGDRPYTLMQLLQRSIIYSNSK